MAIRTHQSISGFVASDPQLSYTERGDARLYMKIGIGTTARARQHLHAVGDDLPRSDCVSRCC